jgi:hypothetical protein
MTDSIEKLLQDPMIGLRLFRMLNLENRDRVTLNFEEIYIKNTGSCMSKHH